MRRSILFSRVLLCAICVLLTDSIYSQGEKKDKIIYNGMIKAAGTISPGVLVNTGLTTMSLHGYLEFFPENRVSWRGDGFYFLGEQKKPSTLYQNSTLKWGPFYHFHKNRLDYYVGIQPGLNFVQPQGQDANGKDYYNEFAVVPVISPVTGINFHFGKFFNMFLEGTYIGGRYLGNGFTKINVSELRLSFGLGLHFQTREDCGCAGTK